MCAQEIKEGDVVMLKSGGPKMTVVSDRGDKVRCEWFKFNEPVGAIFPKTTLKREEDKSEP